MAFAPTYALRGSGVGPAAIMGKEDATFVPVTLTFGGSDTYVTGGYAITLPDELSERKLDNVIVTKGHDGTRRWDWDGSRSAPMLVARDAFATEEGNGTSIASVVLELILVVI